MIVPNGRQKYRQHVKTIHLFHLTPSWMRCSYMIFVPLSVQRIFRIFLTLPWYGLCWWVGCLGFFHVFFQIGKCVRSSGEKLLEVARFSTAAGFLKGNIACVIHLFWRPQTAWTGTVRLTVWKEYIYIGLRKWSCFMNFNQLLPARGQMAKSKSYYSSIFAARETEAQRARGSLSGQRGNVTLSAKTSSS